MTNQIEFIALNKLIVSPLNVRKYRTDEGSDEMQASLLAHGVLENLIVYATDKQKFAVAAGERRRLALKALAKAKKISPSFPVPCLVRPEGEAIELSLAENVLRVAMHPADQFDAFAAMIDEGKTTEDIAARFGVPPQIITRRLKLSRVSPVIMAAYRADDMNLEAVMAFTITDNHAEQERVFSEIQSRHNSFTRRDILQMLTHDKVRTTDRRFKFVGEDAYIAAGGQITRDLFDAEGEGYATDSALLDRLALEKLTLAVPALLAEGWKWIEPVCLFQYEMRRSHAGIHTKHVPLSEQDDARRDAISERLGEIEELCDGCELGEGPLLTEWNTLTDELEAIEARESAYDREEMALAGGWLTLDRDGALLAEVGHVRPDDVAALDAYRKERNRRTQDTMGEEGQEPGEDDASYNEDEETPEPTPAPSGLSDALLTDLHAARTMALRLELANRPDIALRAVAFSLAGRILSHDVGVLTVSAREVYIPALSKTHCPDDDAVQERLAHWRLRLPTGPQLWPAVMKLDDAALLDLIALCAAVSVDATHTKGGDHASRQRLRHADQLAETLELNMATHWEATAENYFGRVSKGLIAEAVTEMAGAGAAKRIEGMKKPVMALEAQVIAYSSGWLPIPLRTATAPTMPIDSTDEAEARAA